MDPQMMQRILQRQGAPDTPQNQNSVSQFAASNPDVLDRYGMNLPAGQDDNSALLKLALDRSIDSTDGVRPGGAQGAGPGGAFTAGEARKMSGIPQQDMANIRGGTPSPVRGATPPPINKAQTQYGEGTGPQLGPPNDARGTGFQSGPNLGGGGTSPNATPQVAGAPAAPEQGGSLMDWLLPALGIFGAGGAALASRPGASAAPAPAPQQLALPAPQKQLPAPQSGPPIAMPDQSGPGGKPQQSAEEVARLKAEVAAENEQGARALQEQLRKQNAQRETGDLVKRAGRAVGRK